jgi:hypothetical protein
VRPLRRVPWRLDSGKLNLANEGLSSVLEREGHLRALDHRRSEDPEEALDADVRNIAALHLHVREDIPAPGNHLGLHRVRVEDALRGESGRAVEAGINTSSLLDERALFLRLRRLGTKHAAASPVVLSEVVLEVLLVGREVLVELGHLGRRNVSLLREEGRLALGDDVRAGKHTENGQEADEL